MALPGVDAIGEYQDRISSWTFLWRGLALVGFVIAPSGHPLSQLVGTDRYVNSSPYYWLYHA
jgi:hypothetical protein